MDHIAKPTYLTKALGLINHYGFSINFTFDINILGGNTPIRDYMSDLSTADIQSLKAKNIIYMDQVISSDGNYLLSWPDVKRNNNNNYSGPIPTWYKKLTDNYVLSNNLRLIHPLNDVVCDISRTHKSPSIIPAITIPKSQCIKVSKQQGNRIKKCNFIYLTIDIQQRNYPRLYSLGSIPCIECAYARDDNVHVGLCKEHSNQIINILTQAAHDLQELIITNTKDAGFDLDDTIRSSPLFNTTFDDILPQSHPGYLLIHHLVLSDLTLIFYNYIKDKKLRFSLFLKFFSTLMSSIDTLIWSRRASLIKQWESTLSITKNKKRFYRQRQKKRAPPPPAPDVSTQNSSPCRNYNHRHVATTPYYRDGIFHDHHAHIR
ncbi:uncharacterized protein OCT59_011507 [Rhizophagus irregularis]|uniref:uncharacterized protein n=1 Tax=Rhizophagus irregularis TaxID=588596 RepID=UPI00332DF675|nr:hypothetical protein OCT59_011507 [Rhizophagus irregularis]